MSHRLLPSHVLCTPPPSKPSFPPLSLPSPSSASHAPMLHTSPLTPYASAASSPPPSRAVRATSSERAVLAALRRQAGRHRAADIVLRRAARAAGNPAYADKRPIIVGWLVDVCSTYRLSAATLHLTVRHLDWFMAARQLHQNSWQCCAVMALFIAAKCEELGTTIPGIKELLWLCEGAYQEDTLRQMEFVVLDTLGWDLVAKTPVHFLTHYLNIVTRALDDAEEEHAAEQDHDADFHMVDHYHRRVYNNTYNNNNPATAAAPQGNTRVQPARAPIDGFMLDEDDDDDDIAYIEDDDDFEDDEDDHLSHSDGESTTGMDCCICSRPCRCSESRHALHCDEDMAQPPYDTHVSHATVDPVDELRRVATCILDLSLYDAAVRERFAPNIIAATALCVAVDVSSDRILRKADVLSITDVWEGEIAECHTILWRLFEEAQA